VAGWGVKLSESLQKALDNIIDEISVRTFSVSHPLIQHFLVDKYPQLTFGKTAYQVHVYWDDLTTTVVDIPFNDGDSPADIIERAKAEAARIRPLPKTAKAIITWSTGSGSIIEIEMTPTSTVFSLMREARERALKTPYFFTHPNATITDVQLITQPKITDANIGPEVAFEYTPEQLELKALFLRFVKPDLNALFNRIRSEIGHRVRTGEAATEHNLMFVLNEALESFTESLLGYFADLDEERPGLNILLRLAILDTWNSIMSDWGLVEGDYSTIEDEVTYKWAAKKDEKTCPICAGLDGTTIKGKDIAGQYPFCKPGDGNVIIVSSHPWCRCELRPI